MVMTGGERRMGSESEPDKADEKETEELSGLSRGVRPNRGQTREWLLSIARAQKDGVRTIADLAKIAGISRATAYRYFPGIEELRIALDLRERNLETPESPLWVTYEMLESEGLAGTTLAGVAESCGVSPMTLHNRFQDRAGLIAAAYRFHGPVCLLAGEGWRVGRGGPLELRLFLENLLEDARVHGGRLRLLLSPDPIMARVLHELLCDLRQDSLPWVPIMLDWMSRGWVRQRKPQGAVLDLLGLVFGRIILAPSLALSGDADDVDAIWRLFLDGPRAPALPDIEGDE